MPYGVAPIHIREILRNILILRAYKIPLELKPNDHQARRMFGEWAQIEMATDSDFQKKILFRNKAQFWLNGNYRQKGSLGNYGALINNFFLPELEDVEENKTNKMALNAKQLTKQLIY